MLELFSRSTQGEDVGVIQFEARRPDGRRLVLELNATPVRDGDQVVGLQGVIRDLTGPHRGR